IIPKRIFVFFQPHYHKILSLAANFLYRRPSEKFIVVGVTGTNGKSTTTHLIAKILESGGEKVGEMSTIFLNDGEKEKLNDQKMTMLGRFALQKSLSQMVKNRCRYAVIETSSEGIKQFRHIGINYDILIFTNLTPEHIESHHGFENYKQAKLKLFRHLEKSKQKTIDGEKIRKIIIANLDDKHYPEFLNFKIDKKIGYSLDEKFKKINALTAGNIKLNLNGSDFEINKTRFHINLLGKFNVYNSLAAVAVGLSLRIPIEQAKKSLQKTKSIPGRMEIINKDQNFTVMVDYAPEPESMKQLYKFILDFKKEGTRIIHILGSCGGGRDIARRAVLGKIAGAKADFAIITNEDPYDDDPQKIIDQVAEGAISAGKTLNKNLFKILDRREAIKKGISLAQKNDLVLITGKGCEQAICIADGEKILWDDRKAVMEILKKIVKN
ncbi:UDP-N-acetylmuramoyl-L-alanyl-D-glutamate--2,6-diaminopimelate ligase, partial [Candidatus Parcubacteria bacterium]|nr:UDP-N-acetylmuramoyl-L-alanyl-D-glutamate--2,6-diaminopimelate ligase [Candidatus Parcubacteria bacterium]